VDAVIIVTPTDTHARLMEVAVKAGKAVFSEKPIALDLAETQRVVRLVQERNVPVQLGFMRRSYDHYENFPDRFEAGYRLQLEAFFAALREGRTPTPGPEDALETLRMAVAATKSWREKRPVKISEITA
jgi:myo-inositol 2-dehydrogenase/D-chiro-inositol 1-dehydrogenase